MKATSHSAGSKPGRLPDPNRSGKRASEARSQRSSAPPAMAIKSFQARASFRGPYLENGSPSAWAETPVTS
jgi:hypothetical protein